MSNILKDFNILEISLVKDGAVQEEFLALKAKSKEDLKMSEKKLPQKILEEEASEQIDIEEVISDEKEIKKTKAEPKIDVKQLQKEFEEVKKEKDQKEFKLKEYEEKEKVIIYKEKANEYKNINSEKSELYKILKEADEKFTDETKEKFNELLKSVNGLIENSELFKEIGNSKENILITDYDKLESVSKELALKENITKEQAMVKILSNDPKLYNEIK